MKYCNKVIKECENWVSENGLMEYGGAKLKDFCSAMGIDDKTYRCWMKKEEFKEAIERGKKTFKSNLSHDLVITLAKVAKGYDAEESSVEYRPNHNNPNQPTIAKMLKKNIHVQPNIGAAIFLLTNLDPEHYQNRQNNNVKVNKESDEDLSLEEINEQLQRLDKLDEKSKE